MPKKQAAQTEIEQEVDPGIVPDPIDDGDPQEQAKLEIDQRQLDREEAEAEAEADKDGIKPKRVHEDKRSQIAKDFQEARKADAKKLEEEEDGDAELRAKLGLKTVTTGESEEEESEEEAEEAETKPEAKAEEAKPEEKPADTIDVVVFGTKMQVSRADPRWAMEGASDDQIRRNAQMTLAAEARLEQANQLSLQAKTQAKTEPEHQPGDEEAGAEAKDAPQKPQTKVDREKIDAIVDRIQNGLPEDGAEALTEFAEEIVGLVTGGGQQPDIQAEVQRTLIQQQNMSEIDGAIRDFAKTNGDLTDNRHLRGVLLDMSVEEMLTGMQAIGVPSEFIDPIKGNGMTVAAVYRQLREDGHPLKTHREVLDEAGKKLRTTFNLPKRAPSSIVPNPETVQKRVAEKRAMQPQPRSAGQRSQAPKGPKPKTRADFIREERARRQPWNAEA